jgi:ADP-ribose pyrophosphatase YjhB (NUDIX family)
MTKFFIKYVDKYTIISNVDSISSVFLLALKDSKILAIKNERGWDISGGHVEEGETPEEALIREIQEEAGASFLDAKLLAVVESDNEDKYKDKVMLVYTTDNFTLGEFTPSEDSFDREVIEVEDFLLRYKDHFDFIEMIIRAKQLFKKID